MGKRTQRSSVGQDDSGPKAKRVNQGAEPEENVAKELTIRNSYPDHYRKAMNNGEQRKDLFRKVCGEENLYRELFAQDRNSSELSDPHALLVNVHKNEDIFEFVNESPEEAAIPRISPPQEKLKRHGKNCIVDQNTFKQNFALFTENQFQWMDWNNMIVAGGSVLACLQPTEAKTPKEKRLFYHRDAYKNSDIDVFLYGLNAKEANEKMAQIYDGIVQSLPGGEDVICFRSQHAVSMISRFPYRHIQIILRLYKSPAEVLMGFDVDVCAVGFDGTDVWMTPRAHHALTYQVNTVDMTRRSPSYEIRLGKYASRGFSILVPNLDESRIDPQIFERRFDQVQGLAKLILITKLETPESRTAYKERQRIRKLRAASNKPSSFLNQLYEGLSEEDIEYNSERLGGSASVSDYSTVFLPWGPNWHAKKIRKLMYTKDMILNSKWYDPKKKFHTHPCFFGSAEEVVKDCCGECPPIPEADQDPDSPYVSGEMTWLDVNPGQQTQLKRIGSFHPITEGDWTEGAYISSEIEDICAAVNEDDVAKLESLIDKYEKETGAPLDLNRRDSSGRTPLHIACFSNSVAAAQFLIDRKARISNRMADGRTAIHICAQYGHYEIISALIKRGGELEEEAEQKADEMDVDEEEKEEEDEEAEDEDEDEGDGEFSIKQMVEQKKKEAEEELSKFNPFAGEDKPDALDIEERDWDDKMTPLLMASYYGRTKAIRILVEEGGADVKACTDGYTYTTAMLAILNNHTPAVKALLKVGYPMEHVNNQHQTALVFACKYLRYDIVKAMITIGKLEKLPHLCLVSAMGAKIASPSNSSSTGARRKKSAFGSNYHSNNQSNDEEGSKLLPTMDDLKKFVQLLLDNKVEFAPSTEEEQAKPTRGRRKKSPVGRQDHVIMSAIGNERWDLVHMLLEADEDCVNAFRHDDTPLDLVENQLEQTNTRVRKEIDHWTNQLSRLENCYTPNNFTPISMALWKDYIDLLKKGHKAEKTELIRSFIERCFATAQNVLEEHHPSSHDKKKQLSEPAMEFYKESNRLEERRKELEKLKKELTRRGAKKFLELRFTDQDLQDRQQRKRNNNHHHRNYYSSGNGQWQVPTVTFSTMSPNNSWGSVLSDTKIVKAYNELFDLVFKGDINKIRAMTTKKPVGKQTHVASFAQFANGPEKEMCTQWTPLMFACMQNKPEVVKELIMIAMEQFTPPLPKTSKGEFVPSINNHDLMKLMNQGIKPGDYLDQSGRAVDRETEEEVDDPNAAPSDARQLNCLVPPSQLILHKSNSSHISAAYIAAYYNSAEALEQLIDIILEKKIPYFRVIDDEQKEETDTSPQALLRQLFESEFRSSYNPLSPFSVAVARGNLDIARMLVQKGGLVVITDDDRPEIYAGLNVDGQKMDWALEHHATTEDVSRNSLACHVAAFFNQPDLIEYLVKEGKDDWKSYYSETYPDRDVPDLDDFKLDTRDCGGATPLHICCFQSGQSHAPSSRLAAAKKILELDESLYGGVLVNMTTKKEGLTPLMVAAHHNQIDLMELLISKKANLAQQCNARGWTALHYAVVSSGSRVADAVELLLKHMTKEQVQLQSKEFKQTALICAAISGDPTTVGLLLKSDKVDAYNRDVGGDYALHHAVRKSSPEKVSLLLSSAEGDGNPGYFDENGVNLTILDTAILSLIRAREQNTERFLRASQTLKIVYDKLGYERDLSQYRFVRDITEILIEQAIASVAEKPAVSHYNRRQNNTTKWTHSSNSEDATQKLEFPLKCPMLEEQTAPSDIDLSDYKDL